MGVATIQAAAKDDAAAKETPEDAAAKEQKSKQAILADVTGKFSALMAIFQADVKLDGEYQKEFQVFIPFVSFAVAAVCGGGFFACVERPCPPVSSKGAGRVCSARAREQSRFASITQDEMRG